MCLQLLQPLELSFVTLLEVDLLLRLIMHLHQLSHLFYPPLLNHRNPFMIPLISRTLLTTTPHTSGTYVS
jgi:hypothetical protein